MSCSDSNVSSFYVPKTYFHQLHPTVITQNLKKYLHNNLLTFQPVFGKYNQHLVVFYIDRFDNNSFCIGSLEDSLAAVQKIQLSYLVPFIDKELYSLSMNNDTFNLFISEQKMLYRFCLNEQFKISYFKTFDFKKVINEKKYFFRFNVAQGFKIIPPYAYIPFGSTSSWNDFMDKKAYFKISLVDSICKPIKVFNTCKEYLSNLRNNKDTYLVELNDKSCVYMYRTVDRLSVFNLDMNETTTAEIKFNPASEYINFDYSQTKDLGYVRWYEITNESNEAVLKTNDGKIVVMKRVKREKIADSTHYEYLIIDPSKNYSVTSFARFQNNIYPQYSYPYKKGFIVFDENLIKAYYYEID
jgi:hypothetical protein